MIKTPIIVNENGDIDIFRDLETTENYLEPIDIKNGEYEIFDSEGRVIEQSIQKKKKYFLSAETETVLLSPSNTFDAPRLSKILKRHLISINIHFNNESSLEDILSITLLNIGYCR